MTNKFTLTASHIQHGLTDKDFSDYAGYPASSGFIEDLPYGDKVLTSTPLTEHELRGRTESILSAANELVKDSQFKFSYKGAEYFAPIRSPSCWNLHSRINSKLAIHAHFNTLLKLGVDTAIDGILHYRGEASGWLRDIVNTGSFNEPVTFTEARKNFVTFLLRRRPTEHAVTMWSEITALPREYITNYPKEDLYHLLQELHEMRHLPQIAIVPLQLTHRYYTELDADLFARAMFRKAKVGPETLTASLHARYLNIISSTANYYIAPAIEAFETGRPPAPFPEVHAAVSSIIYGIIRSLGKDKKATVKKDELQKATSLYKQGSTNEIRKDNVSEFSWAAAPICSANWPHRLLFHLQKLVQCESSFSSLAQNISIKIIEAAKYFGGDELISPPPHPETKGHKSFVDLKLTKN